MFASDYSVKIKVMVAKGGELAGGACLRFWIKGFKGLGNLTASGILGIMDRVNCLWRYVKDSMG